METAGIAEITIPMTPLETLSVAPDESAAASPTPVITENAPELALLVLSPRFPASAVEEWLLANQRSHVAQAWIIDPQNRSARVHGADGSIRCPRPDQEDGDALILPQLGRRLADLLPTHEGAPVEGPCTVEDWEKHPQQDQYELVNGFFMERQTLGSYANAVKTELYDALTAYRQSCRLGKAYCEMDYELPSKTRKNVRVPDVSFLLQHRIPASWPKTGALPLVPDLAAEVVSPHDLATEVEEKIVLYLKSGVSLIWILYPETRSALAIRADGEGRHLLEGQELDGGDLLPGFRCSLGSLFL